LGFLVNSYNFVVPTPDPDQYWDWSSSTGWTLSRSTISGNKFNWNDDATGTNTFLWSYTAINTLDDNENTIRFPFDLDNFSGSGQQDAASVTFAVVNTTGQSSPVLSYGFRIGYGTTSFDPVYQGFTTPNTTGGAASNLNQQDGGDYTNFALTVSTGIIYIQFQRTSTTSVTIGIYSDSNYTTLVEEETFTITTAWTGLDNFQVSTRNGSNEETRSTSGTMLPNLQIWTDAAV
tara:strand:- start:1 stop:699 length:699 start_codon:yes stop_codon:yes gene_type:complete